MRQGLKHSLALCLMLLKKAILNLYSDCLMYYTVFLKQQPNTF